MASSSLQGLPPLPKSLSGLLNFSSSQWKELEKLHAMRTMIQQDLSRSSSLPPSGGRDLPPGCNRLDIHLALLRKEMVGLRQLDMSLLCQLWSLNESIQEYKQLLADRSCPSPPPCSAPWDLGAVLESSDGSDYDDL
ncbi:fam89a [Cordylochernes scorpioides]|uniref:Fam89a n=1 Tax=Cordylochernes scorpioides TaxID=51811 RepID=A0ABY6LLW9_9ARAC|nr:fam89a [Cordylochernes scorpioides]UYV82184.1 fam89a [Cordylochernes scorpioides]